MIAAGTGIEAAIIGGVASAVGSMASAAIGSSSSESGGVDRTSKMGGLNNKSAFDKNTVTQLGSQLNQKPRIQTNLPEFNAPDVSAGGLGMPYKLAAPTTRANQGWYNRRLS